MKMREQQRIKKEAEIKAEIKKQEKISNVLNNIKF